jgi:D-glycero-D-manno-heptose 1,7-bisphosphate phosphatase
MIKKEFCSTKQLNNMGQPPAAAALKAVFLDRDGVVNRDTNYVHKVEDFEFIPGSKVAMKMLNEAGYKLFIISNQSGIGRGYYTTSDVEYLHKYMISELEKASVKIEKIYYCPHTAESNCECRKPNPYFVLQAQKEFDIDLSKSFFIGDHDSDIACGKNSGLKTIGVLSGHQTKFDSNPDLTVTDLMAAAKIICKIKTLPELEKIKSTGKKIVTTNGCFDILHAGHMKALKESKAQGDILIVGLNSDDSVRRLKGPTRPVNNEFSRAATLASLDCVDYVLIFSEDNPIAFLDAVKPDIHTNSEEYGENCIEAETVKKNGGEIYLIKKIPGLSTTKIINTHEGNNWFPS